MDCPMALVVNRIFPLLHCAEMDLPYIWVSALPLLIEDVSFTLYFCSNQSTFRIAYDDVGEIFSMRAAIREANTSSTWNYTERFLSCYDRECWNLQRYNFTNNLVTHHTFRSLLPNTVYSLEFLGCFGATFHTSCTVEGAYFWYSVDITTRPEGKQYIDITPLPTTYVYLLTILNECMQLSNNIYCVHVSLSLAAQFLNQSCT